jgi:hypothetical protein
MSKAAERDEDTIRRGISQAEYVKKGAFNISLSHTHTLSLCLLPDRHLYPPLLFLAAEHFVDRAGLTALLQRLRCCKSRGVGLYMYINHTLKRCKRIQAAAPLQLQSMDPDADFPANILQVLPQKIPHTKKTIRRRRIGTRGTSGANADTLHRRGPSQVTAEALL